MLTAARLLRDPPLTTPPHDDDRPPKVQMVLSGGIGGGFQGIALSPVLLLKTRARRSSAEHLITTKALRCHGYGLDSSLPLSVF